VGILATLLVLRLVEDPPWAKRAAGAGVRIDYVGVGLLVVGVGALQVMLDRGQQEDWFGSPFIVTLAVAAAVGLDRTVAAGSVAVMIHGASQSDN
jgi:DHA2 family multidrug resistance protein